MSKHTPGPWRFDDADNTIVSESRPSLSIAGIDRMDDGGPKDFEFGAESIANARLIAAAPELLEALKFITEQPESVEAWAAAGAAIAKAEEA